MKNRRFDLESLQLPALGVLLVGASALASRQIETIVAAGWFAELQSPYLASLGARWVALLAIVLFLYALAAGIKAWTNFRLDKELDWARRFLGFQVILSWLMAVQTISFVEVAYTDQGALWLPNTLQLLLASSLVALLWPFAMGLRVDQRSTLAFAMANLIGLGAVMVTLEPDVPRGWAASLGLIPAPKDVVMTGRFLLLLPYFSALSPLLWSACLRARHEPCGPAKAP